MLVISLLFSFFFFNDTATTEIYTLSLHDALPILLWLPIGISIKDWEANSSRGWLRLPAQRDSNGSWLNFTQRIARSGIWPCMAALKWNEPPTRCASALPWLCDRDLRGL